MRFREVRGGLRVPVSNEEQELLDLIQTSDGMVRRADLTERNRELARKLVSRDILSRTRQEESLYYVLINVDTLES